MPIQDNLLRLIRQHNIFGTSDNQQNNTSYQVPNFSNQDDYNYDAGARMQELYQPEHEASDRYNTALDTMPERNNPNIWRKLAAIGSSFSNDPKAVERTLYSPYHREMQDWGTKLKAYEPAAQLERQNNANMRAIANQIVSQEQSSRRLERQYGRDETLRRQGDERLRQGDDRIKQGDTRLEQANERLKIASELAKGGQLNVDDFGNARIVRKDGSIIPVNGEYLSFEEKESLRAKTAGVRAAATAANQRPRLQIRESQDPNGQIQRVVVNLDTGEETPVTTTNTNTTNRPIARPKQTQQEQGKGIVNKAQSIKNSNPRWNKFIKIDKGQVIITRPGIFSGPSQEEYDQMYQAIFGTQNQTSNQQNQNQTSNQRVKVRNKRTGATGTVSADNPGLKNGQYERIQ